jgi:DNA invertase Pin-like site-specific DNA recombinase
LDRLRFRGGRVIGVLDGFDSDSPQARMQAGLSGLMSDELRASIRACSHSALQMRAENNRSTGGKVYGYTIQSLWNNFNGGRDVSSEVLASSSASQPIP